MFDSYNRYLVGREAPDFTAPAVMGDNSINEKFNLKNYLKGSYGWVFFYPLDFTFVCPSEVIAHDNRIEEFYARDCKVVGISVDSQYTHLAWKNTPPEKGGLGKIHFPMVSDLSRSIAKDYGILVPAGVTLRASFLIDRKGNVRHQVINDLPLGRNVDEALRMIDALIHYDTRGEVCPAGWQKGDKAMQETPESVAEYLAENASKL